MIETLGLRRSEELIDVLTSSVSSDVEACPGSGKTTALGLKAALELALWRDPYRGLLVLSHTNVARREIEKVAASIPGCASVLHPPHFVGTIQSFVDRFVAMPYARGAGYRPRVIDDDVSAAVFSKMLAHPRYSKARGWFAQSGREIGSLELGLEQDTVTLGGQAIPVATSKPTYRQLLEMKSRAIKFGIFSFGDMYTLAERCLRDNSWLAKTMQNRFPLILIDEMQDTNERQLLLLHSLFPPDKVRVHRFGDSNQAIFGPSAEISTAASFPRPPSLALSESQRFGTFIAGAVSGISANRQTILGAAAEVAAPHSIILYDERSVHRVLERFAEIVASTEPPGSQLVADAVGYRRSQPKPKDGQLRPNLATYLPSYRGSPHQAAPGTLMAHISEARQRIRTGSLSEAMSVANRGLRELFERWNPQMGRDAFAAMRLSMPLRSGFNAALMDLLLCHDLDERMWLEQSSTLKRYCKAVFDMEEVRDLSTFLNFDAAFFDPKSVVNSATFLLSNKTSVEVRVNTIHAVKGVTHTATLVLETYSAHHDLKRLMPYISGRKHVRDKESNSDRMRLKTVYVAMSRPRSLICLALQEAHLVKADERILEEKGWAIRRFLK